MRIMFLSNFYPPHELGGYEQWCQEVAMRLQSRGHTMSVLTSRHGVDSIKDEIIDNVVVRRSLHLQADIAYYRPLDFFLKRSGQEQENIQELQQMIGQFKPDLIMVWGMWNLSFNLPYCAEQDMPGCVAYFVSSYWPADENLHAEYWRLPANKLIAKMVKQPLRSLAMAQLRSYPPQLAFQHAVCCSHYVRNTLVEAGKLPSHAGVLYGGSDPKSFFHKATEAGKDDKLHLLYFGRLIHDKGVHTALEAVGLLKKRNLTDKLTLTVLGSGHPDYEAHLHSLVDELDISNHVKFVSQVPRDEIPEYLKRFDAFLFTSIWPEPMARSVMEAMAAGLLVIGSEVGGQIEMLDDGQNALTFPSEDASALADNIARVLDDDSLRIRLAQAGQKMVMEKFTLERMVDDIEAYLQQIVDIKVKA